VPDVVLYEERQTTDRDEVAWAFWLDVRPYVGALFGLACLPGLFAGYPGGALTGAAIGAWFLVLGVLDDGTMHIVVTTSEVSLTVGRRRSHVRWPVATVSAAVVETNVWRWIHDANCPWSSALLTGTWWYERSCPVWGQLGRWRSPATGVRLCRRDGRSAFVVSRRPEELAAAIRRATAEPSSSQAFAAPLA